MVSIIRGGGGGGGGGGGIIRGIPKKLPLTLELLHMHAQDKNNYRVGSTRYSIFRLARSLFRTTNYNYGAYMYLEGLILFFASVGITSLSHSDATVGTFWSEPWHWSGEEFPFDRS